MWMLYDYYTDADIFLRFETIIPGLIGAIFFIGTSFERTNALRFKLYM